MFAFGNWEILKLWIDLFLNLQEINIFSYTFFNYFGTYIEELIKSIPKELKEFISEARDSCCKNCTDHFSLWLELTVPQYATWAASDSAAAVDSDIQKYRSKFSVQKKFDWNCTVFQILLYILLYLRLYLSREYRISFHSYSSPLSFYP